MPLRLLGCRGAEPDQARVLGGVSPARAVPGSVAGGKARLRASTRRSYQEHIDLYLRPALGHIMLADLRDQDVEQLYEAMRALGRSEADEKPGAVLVRLQRGRAAAPAQGRPLSAARIRRVHATVMSALNAGVRRKYMADNPGGHVELPGGRRPQAVVWTRSAWRTERPPASARRRRVDAGTGGVFLD